MNRELVPHQLGICNKLARMVWHLTWLLLYRPTPRPLHPWRCFLLKIFGAKLGKRVHPYPSSKIWAPWNLNMGDHACLGEHVDCYNVAPIHIGANATVSQYSFLCSASHDHSKASMPLIVAPIFIGDRVWVTADVFVGPGVIIGDGCVVTARSTVLRDLPSWQVARGNPAVPYKIRSFQPDL